MSRRNLILVLFVCFLTACSSDVFLTHTGNMPSESKIAEVKIGQTKEEVEQILGSPSSVSVLDHSTWFYMSSTVKKVAFLKPKVMTRDILSIRFDKEGKVAKITQLNKDDGKEVSVDKEVTESVGHNIGFFRKYFGGVGAYMPFGTSKEK